jgi:hypothetical protein
MSTFLSFSFSFSLVLISLVFVIWHHRILLTSVPSRSRSRAQIRAQPHAQIRPRTFQPAAQAVAAATVRAVAHRHRQRPAWDSQLARPRQQARVQQKALVAVRAPHPAAILLGRQSPLQELPRPVVALPRRSSSLQELPRPARTRARESPPLATLQARSYRLTATRNPSDVALRVGLREGRVWAC